MNASWGEWGSQGTLGGDRYLRGAQLPVVEGPTERAAKAVAHLMVEYWRRNGITFPHNPLELIQEGAVWRLVVVGAENRELALQAAHHVMRGHPRVQFQIRAEGDARPRGFLARLFGRRPPLAPRLVLLFAPAEEVAVVSQGGREAPDGSPHEVQGNALGLAAAYGAPAAEPAYGQGVPYGEGGSGVTPSARGIGSYHGPADYNDVPGPGYGSWGGYDGAMGATHAQGGDLGRPLAGAPIAGAPGFGAAEDLSDPFARQLGTTPAEAFAQSPAPTGTDDDYYALIQEYAPMIAALAEATSDPYRQAAIAKERLTTFASMGIPESHWLVRRTKAIYDAASRRVKIQEEGLQSTREWRGLGKAGIAVGIGAGLSLILLLVALTARARTPQIVA